MKTGWTWAVLALCVALVVRSEMTVSQLRDDIERLQEGYNVLAWHAGGCTEP